MHWLYALLTLHPITAACTRSRLLICPWFMVYGLWWVVANTQQISQSWCEERKAEEDDSSEHSGESAYGETRSRWLFNCNCGNLRQNCKLAEAVLWRLRLQAAVHWPSASDVEMLSIGIGKSPWIWRGFARPGGMSKKDISLKKLNVPKNGSVM